MKRKQINLAHAMCKNQNCYGFIWRFSNGKFGYQNDNDLGLDLEAIGGKQPYVKKIKVDNKHYVYQMFGGFEDDGSGVSFKTALALLRECHKGCLGNAPLTKQEQNLCKKYWAQF